MSNLGPQQQNDSYNGLLQIPGGVTSTLQPVQDGMGNLTGLWLSSLGTNVPTSDTFIASNNGTPFTNAIPRLISDGFGDYVSVKDFGAVGNGVADDTNAFNRAAAVGTTVHIPYGNYKITASLTRSFWVLDYGAYISGLPDVDGINNTTRLTGRIFSMENDVNGVGIRIGSPDPWIEGVRFATEAISEVVVSSNNGQIGLLSGTKTSGNNVQNYAAIGLASYGINDNTTAVKPSWAAYLEARRVTGAGAAYCAEMDYLNTGTTYDLTPFSSLTPTTTQSVNLWISNGAGDISLGGNPNSAAITILPNPASFKRGIVFRSNALDGTTNEAITMGVGQQLAWYNSLNVLNSTLSHRALSMLTQIDSALGNTFSFSKYRDIGATQSLDSVFRANFFGNSGSSAYNGGFFQCIQRGNFSGGNARFSFDIQTANSDGTTSQVTLNGVTEKAFTPATDNFLDLGSGSFRWAKTYSTNYYLYDSTTLTMKQVQLGASDSGGTGYKMLRVAN